MSIAGIVLTLLVTLTVSVGVIAGVVSSTSHQPTTYAWRPAYQPIVVSGIQQDKQERIGEDVYDALELMSDEEAQPAEIDYETSIPNLEMEAGIDELLNAVSPIESEREISSDSMVFDNKEPYIEAYDESNHDSDEIFNEIDCRNFEREESNAFDFDDAPSFLEARDYQTIVKEYGPAVADQITTTPARGMSSQMGDVMIGRLEHSTVGLALVYRDHFVLLKGQINDNFIGKPVLVRGQFGSPEEFYVSSMMDPAMIETNTVPFFGEMLQAI